MPFPSLVHPAPGTVRWRPRPDVDVIPLDLSGADSGSDIRRALVLHAREILAIPNCGDSRRIARLGVGILVRLVLSGWIRSLGVQRVDVLSAALFERRGRRKLVDIASNVLCLSRAANERQIVVTPTHDELASLNPRHTISGCTRASTVPAKKKCQRRKKKKKRKESKRPRRYIPRVPRRTRRVGLRVHSFRDAES
jgi:hypothetical protein